MAPNLLKILQVELTNVCFQITSMVQLAVAKSGSFDELERKVHHAALDIGRQAVDLFVSLQGDGDLGPKVVLTDDRTFYRSNAKSMTKIRSIFAPPLAGCLVPCVHLPSLRPSHLKKAQSSGGHDLLGSQKPFHQPTRVGLYDLDLADQLHDLGQEDFTPQRHLPHGLLFRLVQRYRQPK